MSVTKEFAVKIDTQLSELHNKRWNLIQDLLSAQDSLKFYQKHYPNRVEESAKYEQKIVVIREKLFQVGNEILDLNAIYDQDPWTRAFLVLASNGHVHSSMDCSTCFPTTRYNWLVQYSNDDEKAIVEDAGQDACTICYPSAPAEVLNRPSRIVTVDKIAKAQAKAERDAKREARLVKEKADAPTASGEFLTYKEGKYTRVIKTERTAVSEWFNLQWGIERGDAFAQEIADLIVRNIAEKHGVSFEQQLEILNNKLKKRKD